MTTLLPLHSPWVEETLSNLTLNQKIGQLLHPAIQPRASEAERIKTLGGAEPGGVFLFSGTRAQFIDSASWFQQQSAVPVIISSDLENGAGRIVADATLFPRPMALAAANDANLAFEMGRATAIEGRALGAHWSFSPVVDMNINPHAPETSTRSLGDNPERIARLARAIIKGMQINGMAATAKHFPGSGLDDRDQHLCTALNPLRMDQWWALSGRMFQEAIEAGVWSIMIGHIGLPAWDAGAGQHLQDAPPATLSYRTVTELLRQKMGFEGVIITDALDMAGVTAWGSFEELIPRVIEAGNDMILFSDMQRDFPILKRAVETGRLSQARIDASVRRILALKEKLGLPETPAPRPASPANVESFRQSAKNIAQKAVTLVKNQHNTLPFKLPPGARVLSYHLRGNPAENVDAFDDLLRARGLQVTHYNETEHEGQLTKRTDFSDFDAILVNITLSPSWGTNRIRPAGNFMRDVWSLVTSHHPQLAVISYGSPYAVYEMPHVPLVINAYSPDANTQQAVLRLLFGELQAVGSSPVDLNAPYFFKGLEGLRR